jgi:signal peptidase I
MELTQRSRIDFPDPAAAPAERHSQRGLRRAPRWLSLMLIAVIGVGLTLAFVAEPVQVSANSMSPTLRPGDHVLVEKISHRSSHPHRRDLIAFTRPGSGQLLIKRVVGVAGDTVAIEDGVLVVNGTPVVESFVDPNLMDATYFGPVTVAAGAVFVMGDDRPNSVDSRTFGTVSVDNVAGRVIGRLWPPRL